MATKEPRKGIVGILDRLLVLMDGVKGIAMIFAALSVGGVSGTIIASDKDSVAKVDSLAMEMDSLKARQTRMEGRQMEMFSAQVEADTALHAILEQRAADHRKGAESRASIERLFKDIAGSNP